MSEESDYAREMRQDELRIKRIIEDGKDERRQRIEESENAQWLRFAEAIAPAFKPYVNDPDTVKVLADFADAMLEEAKKRGRV